MATQLLEIVRGSFVLSQALSAFFKVKQRYIDLCTFTAPDDTHKDVFGVQTTMLPTPQVHARQGPGNGFKHPLMDRFTMALVLTGGVPVVNFNKTVKGCGYQQCPPLLVRPLFGPAVN